MVLWWPCTAAPLVGQRHSHRNASVGAGLHFARSACRQGRVHSPQLFLLERFRPWKFSVWSDSGHRPGRTRRRNRAGCPTQSVIQRSTQLHDAETNPGHYSALDGQKKSSTTNPRGKRSDESTQGNYDELQWHHANPLPRPRQASRPGTDYARKQLSGIQNYRSCGRSRSAHRNCPRAG